MLSFFRGKGRRQRLLAGPFPESWRTYLRDNVLLYRALSEAEQAQLRDAVRVVVAEKRWEGCAGFEVTDEVRVTVAGQACLMLLGFDGYYFDEVKTVLVYPGGYLAVEEDELGAQPSAQHVLGQAAQEGPVAVSWWHARWGGRQLGFTNVVIHEFAHKLAELGDPDAGMPPVEDAGLKVRWRPLMLREYEKLVEDADYGRPTLLDHYGAESPAEFFAVTSECFFLKPAALRRRHPELYQLLRAWYRQDPAERPVGSVTLAEARAAEEEYTRHALAECTAALRHRPDHAEAYRHRAALHAALGEFEQALADCAQVIRLADPEERAAAYRERGEVHLRAGSYAEAVADFTEAVRLRPDFAAAYRDRGAARAAQGRRQEALADLTHAVRLDPKDDGAYLERGALHSEAGDYAKALRDLTRALRLSPHDAAAYSDRAAVYVLQGEYGQAIADCDEAIGLDPGLPEPYKHRGVARHRQGDFDRALADLGEAIRLDPHYAEAYRDRAEVYRAKGEEDEALRDLEHARGLEEETGDE